MYSRHIHTTTTTTNNNNNSNNDNKSNSNNTNTTTTNNNDNNNINSNTNNSHTSILAIFYPPLKWILGCVWLCLQAQEGNSYFTELAERVEYGNYGRHYVIS